MTRAPLHPYTDLELRILAREPDSCPVELTPGHMQEFPHRYLAMGAEVPCRETCLNLPAGTLKLNEE